MLHGQWLKRLLSVLRAADGIYTIPRKCWLDLVNTPGHLHCRKEREHYLCSESLLTTITRSLGAIIILTLASLNPDLQAYVPDIDELQMMAIKNFEPWAFSSLEAVLSILEDIRKKRRLLLQV